MEVLNAAGGTKAKGTRPAAERAQALCRACVMINSEASDAARNGRRGAVDGPADARKYGRLIGCQARTALDFKKNEVALFVIPRT